MLKAREAFQAWKGVNKVNLQVLTDEQMFIVGYNMAEEQLADMVVELLDENKTLKEKLECLKVKQEKAAPIAPSKTEISSTETGTESSKRTKKKVDKKALMSL
jgi:uncharacterized phage infection (PIP) family protein YhgE